MDKEKAYVLGVAQTQFRENYKRTHTGRKAKILPWVILSLVLVLGILLAGFSFTVCRDRAMEHKVEAGEFVVVDRFSYLIHTPQRGETIAFWLSDGTNESIVYRRVIGLPGDEIDIRGGDVYLNGHRCLEEYTTGVTESEVTHFVVPSDQYFVLCDNRAEGPDSRNGFYVLADSLAGSVVYSVEIPEKLANSPIIRALEALNKLT